MTDRKQRDISEQANREVYFDILRIISTFSVMILHIAAQNWYKTDIHSFDWNVFNFYDSIFRWGVPIFMMISGALFLGGTQSIGRIYRKNILRIITAFAFWSFFYAATSYFIDNISLKNALKNFISGHYHMWFLFAIVGLYMIVPFLRAIVKKDFLVKYFLILSAIFTFIIPQATSIISIISESRGTFIKGLVNKVSLNFVLGYTVFFILGCYLNRTAMSKRMTRLIYVFGAAGFVSTIICTVMASRYLNKPYGIFYGYFTLNVLLESVFVFVLCKNLFSNIKFGDKTKKILFLLSKYSFGAYLIHVFIIGELKRLFGLNTLSFNSLIAVPVIAVIVFCISTFISAVINHIPVLNKYIV